jgi:adenylylsulfate kinase
MDSHSRSLLKAISYRFFGSLVTALIFLVLTGNVKVSAGAGVLDCISKVILYFLHERIWAHIHLGRQHPPVKPQ